MKSVSEATLFPAAGLYGVAIKEKEDIAVLQNTDVEDPVCLVVWNDSVNTFDWVIESLVDVCGHSHEQAEQCAWIIHHNGKYGVKHGTMRKLKPMREALVDRGIGATLEEAS
ncbi:MAG: ATP-dependent Clp protease adaptor ClpS [Bacteroidia bacterium]|nr:ATP-dependent Clp protease adaptor ClpS [Bacteroidia bacterium]